MAFQPGFATGKNVAAWSHPYTLYFRCPTRTLCRASWWLGMGLAGIARQLGPVGWAGLTPSMDLVAPGGSGGSGDFGVAGDSGSSSGSGGAPVTL